MYTILEIVQYLSANRNQHRRHVIWYHMIDSLAYCLRGKMPTAFGDRPHQAHLRQLRESLRACVPDVDTIRRQRTIAYHNRSREVLDATGYAIDIDEYVSRSPRAMIDYRRQHRPRLSLTLLFDMGVCWAERGEQHISLRTKRLAEYIASATRLNKATRIIGLWAVAISELPHPLQACVIIKDFGEPLHAITWGLLRSNLVTNTYLNVVMDYIIGTTHPNNGVVRTFETRYAMFGDGVILDPRRIQNTGDTINRLRVG